MKPNWQSKTGWRYCFFGLILGYGILYAPFGINETDGGFLTGLAWQMISGKTLYADVVYVRPPLPVWLRTLELQLFPDYGSILTERWIFYAKVALYSWLGAAVLSQGVRRWQLAALGFVLSAHCYPAAAWHTVDGILFGALSIWCWTNWRGYWPAVFSGLFMASTILCKQSFYPMPLVGALLVLSDQTRPRRRTESWIAFAAFAGVILFFAAYLYAGNRLSAFLQLTSGAASGNEALQHGVLDYFRIQPVLLSLSVLMLVAAGWWAWKRQRPTAVFWAWFGWLLLLAGAYTWAIFRRQEFTAPFAQTRLLFWMAGCWWAYRAVRQQRHDALFALLALSWCASVSWGYNLPVLFALPWAYVAWEISTRLSSAAYPGGRLGWAPAGALILLLAVFRWGYAFVYRDGPRAAMTEHLGAIFPSLTGIYSTPETAEKYRELRDLTARYGPHFKTLPAFPLANYLTHTPPPLPLDWVVQREMGRAGPQVDSLLQREKPVLLVEKAYLPRLDSDPELWLTRNAVKQGRVVEETQHFAVVRL